MSETEKAAIVKAIEDSPEVDTYHYESKETALEKIKELYPDLDFEGDDAVITPDAIQQSYWVTLEDPNEDEGLKSAVSGWTGSAM